jgi:hypothetical protein
MILTRRKKQNTEGKIMGVLRITITVFVAFLLSVLEPTTHDRQAYAAPLMSEVMTDCEHMTTSFNEYVQCVKNIYDGEGARPDAPVVKLYYYQLDELSERYLKKEISQAKAMSEAYRAYMESIGNSNKQRR